MSLTPDFSKWKGEFIMKRKQTQEEIVHTLEVLAEVCKVATVHTKNLAEKKIEAFLNALTPEEVVGVSPAKSEGASKGEQKRQTASAPAEEPQKRKYVKRSSYWNQFKKSKSASRSSKSARA